MNSDVGHQEHEWKSWCNDYWQRAFRPWFPLLKFKLGFMDLRPHFLAFEEDLNLPYPPQLLSKGASYLEKMITSSIGSRMRLLKLTNWAQSISRHVLRTPDYSMGPRAHCYQPG